MYYSTYFFLKHVFPVSKKDVYSYTLMHVTRVISYFMLLH